MFVKFVRMFIDGVGRECVRRRIRKVLHLQGTSVLFIELYASVCFMYDFLGLYM